MKTQDWLIFFLSIILVLLMWKNWQLDQALGENGDNEKGKNDIASAPATTTLQATNMPEEIPVSDLETNALDAVYGHWTPPEKEKYVADPDGPLDEGFEWTDEYYDPDRIEEPGYRDMVVSAIYTKHYYESPERKQPPFRQSKELLEQWGIEPTLDNTIMVHDAAFEWHMHKQFAEEESGPAAGPDGKEMAAFKMKFQRKNIRSRLAQFLGIKDKTFFEQLIEIKPESGILTPLLIIKPGDRLMQQKG